MRIEIGDSGYNNPKAISELVYPVRNSSPGLKPGLFIALTLP
ncbi:MAG TPA: hypothetical protein VFP71_01820 [Candidatus Angelobacter sp.]|nr:hypothetical protein [Candidatus Angelobacter sp.]